MMAAQISSDQHKINMLGLIRMTRYPLAFTAASNVIAGYCLVCSITPENINLLKLLMLILISICLYSAGMILNDIYDYISGKDDKINRPLPRGQVTVKHSVLFAIILIVIALLLAELIGIATLYLTSFLIFCIILYDSKLKEFRFVGAILMGICRGLNLMLGITGSSQVFALITEQRIVLILPMIFAIYIFFVTLASTLEDDPDNTLLIWPSILGILASIMLYFFIIEKSLELQLHAMTIIILCGLFLYASIFSLFVLGTKSAIDIKKLINACLYSILGLDSAIIFACAKDNLQLMIIGLIVLSFYFPADLLTRIYKQEEA